MIFLIFTTEGLAEAAAEIKAEKATLWLNPGLQENDKLSGFIAAGCDCYFLPEQVDAGNEKAVLNALSHVEKNSRDNEIYVEYL
ncbi:hypothetical protein GCM10007891_17150 [Methylophaga thalassica]|uniref:Uncharacterized protein n=1 Tax=Methylophaga thalassica TaxID=40223 RepID=A0ABQ5TWL8_9GAMM|nr:hypothetical protein [Methylophaga thalassica]GLP99861.1 hypothetical protein GCM10007891_17150 [Methylophaga thalassica]